jgi:hypothetical protein
VADREHLADRELDRQGRRLAAPSGPFLLIALLLAVVGVVLVIVGSSGLLALGIVLIVLAGPPAVVGISLLAAAAVSRWAARRHPFA